MSESGDDAEDRPACANDMKCRQPVKAFVVDGVTITADISDAIAQAFEDDPPWLTFEHDDPTTLLLLLGDSGDCGIYEIPFRQLIEAALEPDESERDYLEKMRDHLREQAQRIDDALNTQEGMRP